MENNYINKVKSEIENLKGKGRKFWFDFNVSTEEKDLLVKEFESIYTIEIKTCISCGGNKHDVTINL